MISLLGQNRPLVDRRDIGEQGRSALEYRRSGIRFSLLDLYARIDRENGHAV